MQHDLSQTAYLATKEIFLLLKNQNRKHSANLLSEIFFSSS